MATEDDLIRRLRVLYGIDPNEAAATNNQPEIHRLMQELANQSEMIIPDNRYSSGDFDATPVQNPEHVRISNELARVRGAPQIDAISRAEANKNRGLLDSIFGGIRKSTLDDGTRELNTRFTDTLRSQNTALAARGLTGGSADRSRQGRTLGDLLLGRQRLAGAADTADQTSRQSLDEQRQQTERQIKLGTQPDVSSINAMQQAQAGLNQAYKGLTQQALGGLFERGADTYRDINQADASGRRGWGMVAPAGGRGGSSGGSFY